MAKKIYTIRINEDVPDRLWYASKQGSTFDTQLTIVEGAKGNQTPAFKLSGPPFFHVYPHHCTVVGEKLLL